MLTLRPGPAESFQMDWSLNPNEEIKTESEDDNKTEPGPITNQTDEIKNTKKRKDDDQTDITESQAEDIKKGEPCQIFQMGWGSIFDEEIKSELEDDKKCEPEAFTNQIEEIKVETERQPEYNEKKPEDIKMEDQDVTTGQPYATEGQAENIKRSEPSQIVQMDWGSIIDKEIQIEPEDDKKCELEAITNHYQVINSDTERQIEENEKKPEDIKIESEDVTKSQPYAIKNQVEDIKTEAEDIQSEPNRNNQIDWSLIQGEEIKIEPEDDKKCEPETFTNQIEEIKFETERQPEYKEEKPEDIKMEDQDVTTCQPYATEGQTENIKRSEIERQPEYNEKKPEDIKMEDQDVTTGQPYVTEGQAENIKRSEPSQFVQMDWGSIIDKEIQIEPEDDKKCELEAITNHYQVINSETEKQTEDNGEKPEDIKIENEDVTKTQSYAIKNEVEDIKTDAENPNRSERIDWSLIPDEEIKIEPEDDKTCQPGALTSQTEEIKRETERQTDDNEKKPEDIKIESEDVTKTQPGAINSQAEEIKIEAEDVQSETSRDKQMDWSFITNGEIKSELGDDKICEPRAITSQTEEIKIESERQTEDNGKNPEEIKIEIENVTKSHPNAIKSEVEDIKTEAEDIQSEPSRNKQMGWSFILNEEIKIEPEDDKICEHGVITSQTDEIKSATEKQSEDNEEKTEDIKIESEDVPKAQLDPSKGQAEEIKVELEEIKSEPEDIKNDPESVTDVKQRINAHDVVTVHFAETFRRLPHLQNGLTSSAYHPQSHPNAFLPYKRLNNIDSKPPKLYPQNIDYPRINSQNNNHQKHPNTQRYKGSNINCTLLRKEYETGTLTPINQLKIGQYDVENISTILKTVQVNKFINTSLINDEIKMEPLDKLQTNGVCVPSQKREVNGITGFEIFNKQYKLQSPPLLAVSTDVDIEAQLPSTSIKQWTPEKKKRPSKPKIKKNDPEIEKEKPLRVLKKCANRSTKRKTNYCEASSDEETKRVKTSAHSRSRFAFKPIKNNSATAPAGPPVAANVEIKQETVEIKMELDLEIKKEDQPKVETENSLEIKTEDNLEIKTELLSEEIKKEIKDEPLSPTDSPSPDKACPLKPKRVRNPAAIAAARRRSKKKDRLHPLNRKEQIMMNKLMQSQEPFLQNVPCLKLASRASKCRECRYSSRRSDSQFCRFFDFRRLRFKDKSVLVVDGFSDPNKDPGPNDIAIWMPGPPPRDIDLDVCRYIIMHVGEQFCKIFQEEQNAINEHMSANKTIAWKKVVKGVREICDVCETTLFNFHWTCSKCGFGVCIDCYKDRKRKKVLKKEKPGRDYDDHGWLVCTCRETHQQTSLMLTQIIPGNSLNFLAHRLHEVCKIWKIPLKCGCPMAASLQEDLFSPKFMEISNKIIRDAYLRFYSRESEIKYRTKIKGLDPKTDYMKIMAAETELIEESRAAGTLPIILATTLKHLRRTANSKAFKPVADQESMQDVVTREYNALKTRTKSQRYLPPKVMTSRTSQRMFPGIEHDWLCHGKLLRLLDSRNNRNPLIFQEVWKRGQPVMVSKVCKFLNISLWNPEAFCRDFGEKKNDLINCMTGNLVPNQPMKYFWEGFQVVSKRLLDSKGEPMLLKLKDWPPGDDFAEILPTRYADLMKALPLPEYTLRTGSLNIASRLPNIFVPPDLGPKMYNAYGSALHPDKGTTNLHLDISDAANIMVYVGIPTDASAKAQITAALRAIDGGGCDIMTRRRVRQPGVMPGALWHIYSARDADKIRDLLNRVTIERGYRLEPDHDPIHDQNWYLDNELRERLYDDYGVEGYPMVQCLGDAVFIPAGAPHQVRNLHNCIKVAEDFVSPENIQQCFHLSQQFRKLSMSHTNHEDKLQIRNVIYHAIKDTTSYLTYLLNRQL